MKYALLDGTQVINIILWDGENNYETNLTMVKLEEGSPVSPGWTFVNNKWIPLITSEPEPLPDEDPTITDARNSAVNELLALGISEATARTIVGLPPKEELV